MKHFLTLGIDATNLRRGGTRTHLIELLRAADPQMHGFSKIILWGSQETTSLIEERSWLLKRNPPALEAGLFIRTFWQLFGLSCQIKRENCNIVFVPGGSYITNFRPIVTMSRNMLPFEWKELRRYGFTHMTLKLILLRWVQSRSFKLADGIIFLTQYASDIVCKIVGELRSYSKIIPHGLNTRFIYKPKYQKNIMNYSNKLPYHILYVSTIDQYKHQWNVVEAISSIRQKNSWKLLLSLVGPSYPHSLSRLKKSIEKYDPKNEWVKYHGAIPYTNLHKFYQQADMGIFASSCENMPNILLETMAAGLPVASSNRGPMPEILGNTGAYFNPDDPADIALCLENLISNPNLRANFAAKSFLVAQQYTWEHCADETFSFLVKCYENYKIKRT